MGCNLLVVSGLGWDACRTPFLDKGGLLAQALSYGIVLLMVERKR